MKNPSLNSFLLSHGTPNDLRHLLAAISKTTKYISHAIQTGDLGLAGTSNLYGDDQLALDVLSDAIINDHLAESGLVSELVSEESEEVRQVIPHIDEPFAVCYDPLDGSSLVDTNLAVGSIFGVFPGGDFLNQTGREMLAACFTVYGPRTTFVVALPSGVHEFMLNEVGEFHLAQEGINLSDTNKYFAPGGFKHAQTDGYRELLNHWLSEGHKLRYSGGMVPDINHLIAKRGGLFLYPNDKLRLLFECMPMAYIIESAGGMATDGKGMPILDKTINGISDTTSIVCGSTKEVEKAEEFFKKHNAPMFGERK